MALKFVQTGYSGTGGSGGGTYDHNLLINRGLPDQHTIESITGLRTLLNKKYEKPFSGIPKSDLAFDVATLYDLEVLKNTDIADLASLIAAVAGEVQEARGGMSRLKQYIDSKVSYADWSGGNGGSGGGHVESQVGYPLYEEYRATEAQTIFNLTKTFRKGTHQLEVYLNGLRMVLGDDYTEVTDSRVEFLFPLNADDLVVFQVRAVINSGLHEEYIATAGQTSFKLNNPYGINQNILQIYRNGVLMRKGRDYREIDNVTIEFVYPLEVDDYVTFHQAGATDPIAGTIMESEIGRLKINLGYTTMALHDMTLTTQTDYLDMYVDTFITDDSIDKEKSFEYKFVNKGIEVRQIAVNLDTKPEFLAGTATDVDLATYPDYIILKNLPGGSEAHVFNPYETMLADGQITEALSFMNNRRSCLYFYVKDKSLKVLIRHKEEATPREFTIQTTTGSFAGLSADQTAGGDVHLVYHETGNGRSKIGYVIIDTNDNISQEIISDINYDAINASIDVDHHDDVHIVFMSKRVNPTYYNVEYMKITAGVKSGFKEVSHYTSSDASMPQVAVGTDDLVRVVFETIEYDNFTKNLKYVVLENSVVIHEDLITHSTTFENIMPAVDIDRANQLKVAWQSKRITSNFGIDICTINSSHIMGSVQSVVSGSFACGRPKIAVDYEDITHVVFNANYDRNDHESICYSFVYPDNTITAIESVAYTFGKQFTKPTIHAHGSLLTVGFIGDSGTYRVDKSLANYTGMGRYDVVIDSKTPDSAWQSLLVDMSSSAGTAIKIEYRISNDEIYWTSWKDYGVITNETATGRYLQARLTLTSTDSNKTPEVHGLQVKYTPTFIEIQSTPKTSIKDVDTIIVIGKYTGDVTFQVSRDGGQTFADATPEVATDVTAKPFGKQVVVKAKIPNGARLDAWASLW